MPDPGEVGRVKFLPCGCEERDIHPSEQGGWPLTRSVHQTAARLIYQTTIDLSRQSLVDST